MAQENVTYFKFISSLFRRSIDHNPFDIYGRFACTPPEDVEIKTDDDLTQIILTGSCEWEFTVTIAENSDIMLRAVFLTSGDITSLKETEVFHLQSVHVDNQEEGHINKVEWYINEIPSNTEQKSKRYSVKVKFEASKKDVHRAILFFIFTRRPVVFMRLCADYTEDTNINRLIRMKKKQLSLISKRWKGPYVTYEDCFKEEEMLSTIYPYPDERSFYMTHDSDKNVPVITRDNYRGRLHEIISLEEIARNHLLSGFDQTNVSMYLEPTRQLRPIYDAEGNCSPSLIYYAQISMRAKVDELFKPGFVFLSSDIYALLKRNESSHILKVPIHEKGRYMIRVMLDPNCVNSWRLQPCDTINVDVQFAQSHTSFSTSHWGADVANIDRLLPNKEAKEVKVEITESLIADDPIQQQVINTIVSQDTNPLLPIVIKGGAGTGKKKMISASIKELVNMECTILLCTRGNNLADCYIQKYLDDTCEANRNIKLLRLYNPDFNSDCVDPTVMKYCCLDEEYKFVIPDVTKLQKYDIIVTTINMMFSLVIADLSITHLIMEEACTIVEWDLLMPLFVAKENTRLIIVGDPFQSKPKIYSTVHDISESILDNKFYNEKTLDRKNNPYMILMTRVYRMNPRITRFLNRFTPQHLEAAKETLTAHLSPLEAMVFYAIVGNEEKVDWLLMNEGRIEEIGVIITKIASLACLGKKLDEGAGYENDKEAEELVKRVLELKKMWPSDIWGSFDEKSIGVYTCFRAQWTNLYLKLKSHRINVHLATYADGIEYTAVFISTVRSSRNGKSFEADNGFVMNPRLIYNAMSRAKEVVAVVGDPTALVTFGYHQCQRIWKKYIKLAEMNVRTKLKNINILRAVKYIDELNISV